MNKRWLIVTTSCLGMIAAPFGHQSGDSLFKAASAQEGIGIVSDEKPLIAVFEIQDSSLRAPQRTPIVQAFDSDQTWTVPGINLILDNIHPSLSFGHNLTRCGVVIGDGMIFQQPKTVSNVEGPFRIDANVITATGANAAAIGPVITTGGTIDFHGSGARYHLVLTNNTVTGLSEPSQPDLSKQFVELSNHLAKLKLKKLNPQLLALEVETLKKEVLDHEAAAKLEEAQEQLRKLLSEYPESPAAQSAKRMLWEGMNHTAPGLAPTPEQPRTVPINTLPTY